MGLARISLSTARLSRFLERDTKGARPRGRGAFFAKSHSRCGSGSLTEGVPVHVIPIGDQKADGDQPG
jgi:hypothetical protein